MQEKHKKVDILLLAFKGELSMCYIKGKQRIVLLFSAVQLLCICCQKRAVFNTQGSLLLTKASLHLSEWFLIFLFGDFYPCWPISSLQFSISSCRVSSMFSFKYCSAWICSFKNKISALSFSSRWSAAVRTLMMSSRYFKISSRSSWIND